jgi:hypothetical protein
LNFNINHISSEIKGLLKQHKALPLILGVSVTLTLIVGTVLYLRRKNRIVRFAKKFIGTEEIAGNMGFANEEFEAMIHEYGDFNRGQQWCMSFAKMVWLKKFGIKYREDLDKLMTPSTQQTWANFKEDDSGKFKTSDKPSKGAIVIWQQFIDGVGTFKGHAGIVQDFNNETFDTIEGNTNTNSEGIVAEKTHKYNWDLNNGLRLKGFISIS